MTFIDLHTTQLLLHLNYIMIFLFFSFLILFYFYFEVVESLYTFYGNKIFTMVALFHLGGMFQILQVKTHKLGKNLRKNIWVYCSQKSKHALKHFRKHEYWTSTNKTSKWKRIRHDISLFQRKTNSILLVKLKKIPYGSLINYFFLDISLYKDFYIPWFFNSKVINRILGKIKSSLLGLVYFCQA